MYLTRSEPNTNLYRFYHMQIVQGLFGDWGLIREWGRIGSPGRARTDWFGSEMDAKDARFDLHMQKAMRGYE
ncbi:MAG: WGR domain-containing protein [Aliishimia sp.]